MKKAAAKAENNHDSAAAELAGPEPVGEAAKPRTLAIDIGGTGVKTIVLDRLGNSITERTRLATPKSATPKKLLAVIEELAHGQGDFERASAGFPGVIKDGVVYTAVNLGDGWKGYDLREAIEKALDRPVKVANDADIQGLGAITGHGIELVITLGTGFGSVIFTEGKPIHLELGHHPFRHGKTYEDELGDRALKKKGRKKWLKILQEAIDDLARTFNYDELYIGGGNSRLIDFKLPEHVSTISNLDGLLGGIKLWEVDSQSERAKGAAKAGIIRKAKKAKGQPAAESAQSDGRSDEGKDSRLPD